MYHINLPETPRILLKVHGNRYLRSGVEFIKINEVKVEIKPSNVHIHFDNLFNGQKALETVGNQVINDNIGLLQNSIIPPIERAVEKKILAAANQVFSKAPASEFLLV